MVTRSAEATRQPAGGLRPAKGGSLEGRQQERSHRRAQAGGAITHQPAQGGLSRRTRNPHLERAGAQLSHGQQRSHSHDEPDQIALSQLGHSLSWHYGLCSQSSPRVAGQNRATGSSGSSPTFV